MTATNDEAPDLTSRVIGYRQWDLVEGELYPLSSKSRPTWRVGRNKAVCAQWAGSWNLTDERLHSAPDPDCHCGLYAYHDLGHCSSYRSHVTGAIAAWGRMEVHENGFRAEYAEPVVFGYYLSAGELAYRSLRRLARKHGRQLVPLAELEEHALVYGQPVPLELRPELAPPSIFDDLERQISAFSTIQKAQIRQAAHIRELTQSSLEAFARYRRSRR